MRLGRCRVTSPRIICASSRAICQNIALNHPFHRWVHIRRVLPAAPVLAVVSDSGELVGPGGVKEIVAGVDGGVESGVEGEAREAAVEGEGASNLLQYGALVEVRSFNKPSGVVAVDLRDSRH